MKTLKRRKITKNFFTVRIKHQILPESHNKLIKQTELKTHESILFVGTS